MKLYHKTGLFILCAGLATACTYDEGPSVDDHFLNYEIGEIPLTADCPVGVYYYNNGSNGVDAAIYGRILEEPDPAGGKVGPWVLPILGNYRISPTYPESVEPTQQHIDWCIEEGKIDFLILPGCQENATSLYPRNINAGDTAFYDFVIGAKGVDGLPKGTSAGPIVDMKSLRFIASVNLDNINSGLSNSALIEDAGTITKEGVAISRVDRFNDLFKRISHYFSDPHYFRMNGKPVVLILNAHRLYAKDSKTLYDNMRTYVKEFCGESMFLVAEQDAWSPPARFQYFYINGGVDAITHKNMYDQGDFNRSYVYPQAIDQNWIYSREFFRDHWDIDYIPTISPSFNRYVNQGANYNSPIVPKSEATFRTMCNVAKKNLGNSRIVFVNSFNQWILSTTLEPTDPSYGNGYGTTYLNIVREQFKK